MDARTPILRQRGFALIAVMFIGAAAMFAASGMFGGDAVAERRAQEITLLKLRAYWAAQGHISYALSRGRQGPPCGNKCNDAKSREAFYSGTLGELNNLGGVDHRMWTYPEVGAPYKFPIKLSSIQNTSHDRIYFDVDFKDTNDVSHPLIVAVWPVREAFRVVVCPGLSDADDPCPMSQGQMDKNSGIARTTLIEPL